MKTIIVQLHLQDQDIIQEINLDDYENLRFLLENGISTILLSQSNDMKELLSQNLHQQQMIGNFQENIGIKIKTLLISNSSHDIQDKDIVQQEFQQFQFDQDYGLIVYDLLCSQKNEMIHYLEQLDKSINKEIQTYIIFDHFSDLHQATKIEDRLSHLVPKQSYHFINGEYQHFDFKIPNLCVQYDNTCRKDQLNTFNQLRDSANFKFIGNRVIQKQLFMREIQFQHGKQSKFGA